MDDGAAFRIHGYAKNFDGPRGDSVFKRARLNQAKGDEGIYRSDGKKGKCACICGKGDVWASQQGMVEE